MDIPHTEHGDRSRRVFDRLIGGQPKPVGKWGWALVGFYSLFLAVAVHYLSAMDRSSTVAFTVSCFVLGGAASLLGRLWSGRRRRLAYRLHATGAVVWQVGIIVFIVGFAWSGQWVLFGWGACVYAVLMCLAAVGAFDPRPRTGDERRRRYS